MVIINSASSDNKSLQNCAITQLRLYFCCLPVSITPSMTTQTIHCKLRTCCANFLYPQRQNSFLLLSSHWFGLVFNVKYLLGKKKIGHTLYLWKSNIWHYGKFYISHDADSVSSLTVHLTLQAWTNSTNCILLTCHKIGSSNIDSDCHFIKVTLWICLWMCVSGASTCA